MTADEQPGRPRHRTEIGVDVDGVSRKPLFSIFNQLIAIRLGMASFAFLSVRVSTPSSSCALICC